MFSTFYQDGTFKFNFDVFSAEDTGCKEIVSEIIRPSDRAKDDIIFCLQRLHLLHVISLCSIQDYKLQ